ncbi:hypothetical protein ABPG72_022743 [Tetrahymena utriculariae]
MSSQDHGKPQHILQTLMKSKTQFCKHEGSCFESFLKEVKRSFLIGYGLRVSLNTLFTLFSLKKSLQQVHKTLQKILLCDGDFRLPLFITLMNSLMKLVQCLLRRVRQKEDGFNSFVSGFLGAFIGMMFENKKNWYTWRMYLGGRAIEMLYNSLINKGYINKNAIHFSFAFAIGSTLIAKGYFHEPRIVENEVFKLYKKFANLSNGEVIWHYCQVSCDEKKLEQSLGFTPE